MDASQATTWRILQLADSGFPVGGFAHSAGLEAAVHCGEVATAQALESFVRAHLWNVGYASVPFVAAAHATPGAVAVLDAEADALLTGHVANRASRTQGRAFVTTCADVFGLPAVRELASRARRGEAPTHLAPAFGVTLAALGVERRECLALFLYLAVRGVTSAAVRLGVIGPLEAQRVLLRHADTMKLVLEECAALDPADAAIAAPLVDIVGNTHDRLFARLFQS